MSRTQVPPVASHMDDRPEMVAYRLRRVRMAFGLSKKEFAERAGLKMQTYGPFENCQRDLTLRAAKLIRQTYGVSLEYLYFGVLTDLPTKVAGTMRTQPRHNNHM